MTTVVKSTHISAKLIQSEGATFVDYIEIDPQDIYVSKTDLSGTTGNNPTRFALDMGNVQALAQSFKQSGQDLSCSTMVVEKLPKPIKDFDTNRVYSYRLVTGAHRHAAMTSIKMDKVIVALYEFENREAQLRFQLVENNHAPSKASTADDLCNALCYAVHQGFIRKDRKAMESYLAPMNKIHGNTKNKAIAMALRETGAYQDYHIYTPQDVKDWTASNGFVTSGKLDNNRNQAGWSVKEGYEYEFLMSAIKKYSEEELESYFVCHAKAPTEKKSLDEKRDGMTSEFRKLEKALDNVFEYKRNNGKYPWYVLGFLPQDNGKKENTLIDA